MAERNADVPADRRIEFRIGINLGDIVVEDDDIFGDGVNIAARLEGMAEPGGICVSGVCARRCAARSMSRSRIWASSSSRTSRGRCGVYRAARLEAACRAPRGATGAAATRQAVDRGAAVPEHERRPEQEYFADGMVEEIITALSRIRWLFVIARNSPCIDAEFSSWHSNVGSAAPASAGRRGLALVAHAPLHTLD